MMAKIAGDREIKVYHDAVHLTEQMLQLLCELRLHQSARLEQEVLIFWHECQMQLGELCVNLQRLADGPVIATDCFDTDAHGVPYWKAAVPRETCTLKVVNAVLSLASYVATRGTAPGTPARGFLIIIGNRTELLSKKLGTFGEINKYQANFVSVIGLLEDEKKAELEFVLPDFTYVQ